MTTSIINPNKKKFAVIIGINYYGTDNQLNGCINDAKNIKTFLLERGGYTEQDILFLADDGISIKPTKQAILDSFNTLINKSVNEQVTELWLSYSGHGTYSADFNKDENDARDELICPVDYTSAGLILDDYIYQNLVAKIPEGTTFFALMDCCNSGTVFDLPYIYNQSLITNNSNTGHKATVISISGCRDDQLSADAYINAKYQGAMTWSFLTALANTNYNIKLIDLIKNMRTLLAGNYTQVPMLAVTSTTDLDKNFIQIGGSTQPPTASTKPIKFRMTTDYWFRESSWNIWSFTNNKYTYVTNKGFSNLYQTTEIIEPLSPGRYKLCLFDSYGDGGITAVVTDGTTILVSAKMYTGKLAEYTFEVKL